MAKGKQSPRQKMINLMYLVFIAMLAMQVDQEVLRSFQNVNDSMAQNIELSNETNDAFYNVIKGKAEEDADYKPTEAKAQVLKGEVAKFVAMIEEYRGELAADLKDPEGSTPTADGEEPEVKYGVLSANDATMNLFFRNDKGATIDKGNDKAKALVAGIENLKEKFVEAGVSKQRVDQVFSLQPKSKNKDWLVGTFYEQPMIAALTNLTKLELDAKTEEGLAIRQMLSVKDQSKIEFNKTALLVSVPKIIQKGSQQDAFVGIGAYSGDSNGTINVNGRSYPLTGGKATIPLATSTGNHTFSGTVTYSVPGGEPQTESFSESYKVVSETLQDPPAGGTITADKMNVVYVGVDNPMSASLNGIDSGISMSPSSGSLSGSNGKYIFRPASGTKTVKFTASGKTSKGQTVSETAEFRVKPVPKATGLIRNETSVSMPVSSISKQTVKVGWPGFEFPVTGKVTSCKVKVSGQPTVVVNGDNLRAAESAIKKAKKGEIVGVFEIKYTSSSGGGRASDVIIEVR